METALLILHLLIAIALVTVVLLQRSEGGALGMGGGSGGPNMFSARGAASLLTRTTAILAFLFIVTSLELGIMAGGRTTPTSVLDNISHGSGALQEAAPVNEPSVPKPE